MWLALCLVCESNFSLYLDTFIAHEMTSWPLMMLFPLRFSPRSKEPVNAGLRSDWAAGTDSNAVSIFKVPLAFSSQTVSFESPIYYTSLLAASCPHLELEPSRRFHSSESPTGILHDLLCCPPLILCPSDSVGNPFRGKGLSDSQWNLICRKAVQCFTWTGLC